MKTRDILLSVSSGLILTLAFPKMGYTYLVWVALLPFLWSLRGKKSFKESFYLGYTLGFVHFSGLFYWIVYVAVTYGNLSYHIGVGVLALLVLYLSLYPAVFAVTLKFFERSGFDHILWAPFLWVSLEYLRSFLLTGFPWENLGCSQFSILKIIQISDIFGEYGISFLIVLVNSTIFLLLSEPIRLQTIIRKEVFLTLAALIFTFLYGGFRIKYIDSVGKDATPLKVALVQGCINQAIKWNPSFQEQTVKIYENLTLETKEYSPDLIIWPETATPFYFMKERDYTPIILDTVRKSGSFLLLGSPAYEEENGKVKLFNRAYLISPEAEVKGTYDKVHLVPFGEYVPLKQFFPFLEKLVGDVGVGDFGAGADINALPIPHGKLGVLICFESIFPELSRSLIRKEVNLLVNITNDAWFGRTSAPYQHFSMAVLRAVENRVFVARCANTGISGFIDPCGRIKKVSPLFERLNVVDTVRMMKIKTFYTKYGDVFATLCLFLSCVWIARGILRAKQLLTLRNDK